MRLLSIVALLFLFNTAFMPLLGIAHEQSHKTSEDMTHVAWGDDQASNGLFQIVHDDLHEQLVSNKSSDPSRDHHCHHVSVMGMVNTMNEQVVFNHQNYNPVVPLFLIEFFPATIEYPPKNT